MGITPMTTQSDGATPPSQSLDLRTVIDAIPALVVSALPDGSVEFVNQGWREYTGRSLEGLTGSGWQAVIHPADLRKFVDEWNAARAAGKPFENEARVRRADGQYHCFLIRKVPLRDRTDQIVRWYGNAYDIDDRKQAEEALRKSEEQWRDVFENNPTMYFMVDEAGSVLAVNPFGAEQLGYKGDELVGQPVVDV